MSNLSKPHYLIIGSAATDDPKTHGGTTLLVSQLLEYFSQNNKSYDFIQAMKYEGRFAFALNYLYVLKELFKQIKKSDIVMVNVASRGAYFLAPFLLLISKQYSKKFVFRMFGGNFHELYKKSNWIKKKLIEYVIQKADIMFFEPQYLVEHYEKVRQNVYWFPNIRKKPDVVRDRERPYQKKIIYLGQIRVSKGLDELLTAAKNLGSEYQIDLYGTLFDKKYDESMLSKYTNVKYKGRVHNKDVYNTLSHYDLLVLPSYMEGYPGVIIEAFGVGLPVVSTNLPSIKEMIDGTNGILVDPKNVEQLVAAIKTFNAGNYHNFSSSALKKFKEYEYESVYERITKICEKNINTTPVN